MRGLAAALLLALAGCAAAPEAPDGVAFLGAVAWDHPDPRHGGLSGIEIGEGGHRVVAITDRSTLVTGRLRREGGAPVAVEETLHHALTTPEGGPLTGFAADSEGLALDPRSNEAVVGFEGYHRVWRFGPDGAGRARLPLFEALSALPTNAGPEAIALDAQGRVLAIPENPQGASFPVWRWDGAEWREAFRLPRRGPMKAVGADLGPDGRLYLLERRLTPLGFRSRVRRFGAEGTGEETVLETRPGRHGNLEGIAAWRDEAGAIRLTMVSDDNFLPIQRGGIVEYRLAPEPSEPSEPEPEAAATARAPLAPKPPGG